MPSLTNCLLLKSRPIQLIIHTLIRQQLSMCPLFDNLPILDDGQYPAIEL